MQHELTELYQQCFPHRNAADELKALGEKFEYEILDAATFIIYIVVAEDEAEIIDIGTKPDMRGKGLATKILNKTITKLKGKGIRTLFLEVAEDNKTAIELYTNAGFEKYNIRKGYYNIGGNRLDAILMKKSI